MASALSDEEYENIYDKLIEPNRYRIVKYFDPHHVFDIMRSRGVFTMDDQERVINMYPPTRRARAGQFLDILQTKGDNGVTIFIEVLEYDYPHVYKLITNKDAKDPPQSFKQHRESIRSKWIDRMGELVDVIKNHHLQNTQLRDQLDDVKAVVNLNQENIQACENDNNVLREQVRILTEENNSYKAGHKNLLTERDRLKDDNLRIQKDCIEYFKEKDYYKDKIGIIQHERDQLELKNAELTEMINQVKIANTAQRNEFFEQTMEKIQNKRSELKKEKDAFCRMEMENRILTDELAERQIKAEELAADLDALQGELDIAQVECSKLKEKIDKEKRERGLVEQWLHEKNEKIKTYFERIGELEIDKQKLEDERNREQQKNKDLDLKYSRLFNEKHQKEQQMDMLKLEIQELKLRLRDSGVSYGLLQDYTCLPESNKAAQKSSNDETGTVSSDSGINLSEYISMEIDLSMLPWRPREYAGRPISTISGPISRSGSSFENTKETFTINLKPPISDKISIVGGNCTGIFVEKVKRLDIPKQGDRIYSICKISENYDQKDHTYFDGLTHSQAKEKLVSKHPENVEITFRREKFNDTTEFYCAKKWMDDPKNSKKGDYFFVRANASYTSDTSSGMAKHKIQVGDIFLVLDTSPITSGEWQALKFEKTRGQWLPLCQAIPDSAYCARHGIIKQQSGDSVCALGRKQAFKKKNMYVNVFPMKATSKLPVLMVGPEDVVMTIQNLMCKHLSSSYILANTNNLQRVMSRAKDEEKHALFHVNSITSTQEIGIVLYIHVKPEDKETLSKILGKDINLDLTSYTEERVRRQGFDMAEVTIPSYEILDEKTLVESIHERVSSMQKHVLWLTESSLKNKPEVVREYQCFFTEDNISRTYARQYSTSVDEQHSIQGQETVSEHGLDTSFQNSHSEPVVVRKDSTIICERNQICQSWDVEPKLADKT